MVSKLEDRALFVFDNLTECDKLSYDKIKSTLLAIADESKSRIVNQRALFSGIKRNNHESLLAYSQRLLKLARESFVESTPSEIIEDIAKTQLLDSLENLHVRSILVLCRDSCSFNELLNKAITLYNDVGLTSNSNQQFSKN